MKVKSLLAKAARCKTEEDAKELLDFLVKAFCKVRLLAGLQVANEESYFENGMPFVRFELNRVISPYYITTIRPEIRYQKLVVVVITNHTLDGFGLSSQSWEPVRDMDHAIEAGPDLTIAMLAKRATEFAVEHHTGLIEMVGVPTPVARTTAKKSW